MTKPKLSYKFNDFILETAPLSLYKNGICSLLTPKALQILLILVENKGTIVSKETILQEVWQDSYVSDSIVAVNLNTIRNTIGKDLITSRKKLGYIFSGEVETEETDNSEKQIDSLLDIDFKGFIGRENELRQLQLAYRNVSQSKGMSIFVGGEAGIGKTDLVRKFLKEIEGNQEVLMLTTSFFDFVGSSSESVFLYFKILYEAFVKLNWLDESIGLNDEILVKTIKEKLAVDISLDLLTQFSANNSDEKKVNQIFFKISECFLAIGKKLKTVIYFDDIQWADEISLNLVSRLIRATKDSSMVILISARLDDETLQIANFGKWLETHTKQNSFTKMRKVYRRNFQRTK
jgi:DNA-binding winged helix-turn-helix (wHTH) protein